MEEGLLLPPLPYPFAVIAISKSKSWSNVPYRFDEKFIVCRFIFFFRPNGDGGHHHTNGHGRRRDGRTQEKNHLRLFGGSSSLVARHHHQLQHPPLVEIVEVHKKTFPSHNRIKSTKKELRERFSFLCRTKSTYIYFLMCSGESTYYVLTVCINSSTSSL